MAANQLILRDHGRTPRDEVLGKPLGSVHGDSIGVHACDSANAWRNLARVGNSQNAFACLILGAYQVALDRVNRGGDFLHWEALPLRRISINSKRPTPRLCCTHWTMPCGQTCKLTLRRSSLATDSLAIRHDPSSICCLNMRSAKTAPCTRRSITEQPARSLPAPGRHSVGASSSPWARHRQRVRTTGPRICGNAAVTEGVRSFDKRRLTVMPSRVGRPGMDCGSPGGAGRRSTNVIPSLVSVVACSRISSGCSAAGLPSQENQDPPIHVNPFSFNHCRSSGSSGQWPSAEQPQG